MTNETVEKANFFFKLTIYGSKEILFYFNNTRNH